MMPNSITSITSIMSITSIHSIYLERNKSHFLIDVCTVLDKKNSPLGVFKVFEFETDKKCRWVIIHHILSYSLKVCYSMIVLSDPAW